MEHLVFVLLFFGVIIVRGFCRLLNSMLLTVSAPKREATPARVRRTRPRRRRAQIEFSLPKVTRKLRGTAETLRNRSVITFERKGIVYRADIITKHGAHTIRLNGHWPAPKFRLRVFPDTLYGAKRGAYPGMEDYLVGQRIFDRDFIIQGTSAVEAKAVLTETVCDRITEHKRLAHGRISIKVVGGVAEFGGMASRLLNTDQVLAIIRNFAEIHRLMLMTCEGELKAELTVIESESSTCMVCGDGIGESFVACKSCGTRHHRDCWNYIGKCSTYGCRSRHTT